MRIITDFDGPIMDISERYYYVYKLCLHSVKYPQQEVLELSKEKFWSLKRNKVKESDIGLMSGLEPKQVQQFVKMRHETVHTIPYLKYDQVVPGAIATLTDMQAQNIDLVVMTMRLAQELEFALNHYHLGQFFPENQRYCLANDYQKISDIHDKPLLMAKALQELSPIEETWMIGDKEADIVAAQNHNIKVIGVLSGIRDRPPLEQYNPDYIVNNLTEAFKIIQTSSI
jgi:phosphoglycolate phosphatase-like HAD superfamily hydrolase